MATAKKSSKSHLVPFPIRMLSPNQYPIRNRTDITTQPAIPTRVIVRQIDMAPDGSLHPLCFIKPDKWHKYDEFDRVLGYVKQGQYPGNGKVNQYYRPLDLKLAAPTRFILWLSNRWEWRFSHKSFGVTLGEFDDNKYHDKYCDLRHVLDNGVESEKPFKHEEFCRIVYFDADPVNNNFHHAFNLNIEMVYPDGGTEPNTLPIVVDPDVRYPGGSGNE